jgi:LPXTG-site transpeptidase (sortase) family protein
MDEFVRKQVQKCRIEDRFRVPVEEGGLHNKCRTVFERFAEYSHLALVFMLIFGSLMIFSNWRSFAVIVDDIIGSVQIHEAYSDASVLNSLVPHLQITDDDIVLESVVFPPDYRLEIPSLFYGTIPVRTVVDQNVNFAQFYDQAENSIQEELKSGVVRYPFTADPNEHGNVFVTGHSSNYRWADGLYNEVFALLHKLRVGDEYSLYFGGRKYTYVVFAQFEVEPDDVSVLHQPLDKKMSTLMTCTPLGTTLKRLIVQADLVSVEG